MLIAVQIATFSPADFSKERQQTAIAATVRIVNSSRDAEGSGIIIGAKGPFVYILTAHHVIARANRLKIMTFSAASYPKVHRVYHTVRVIAEASGIRDLALLRVTTNDRMPGVLKLCPVRLVPQESGFKALSVGCPEGRAPTCLVDEVEGKKLVRREATGKSASFWEVNRKHLEGRSGGPIIDKQGHLLGVCSGTNRERTYFCHTEEIRAFLKESGLDSLP
jgi:hypothetical protein